MERDKLIDQCVHLAWYLWRGMDPQYKQKYARVIWDQFQNRLQGEAMTTANLGQFVNSLCSKLGVHALGIQDDLEIMDSILNSGEDRAILKVFREEVALIVVRVRLWNEQRREEWLRQQEESQQEELLDGTEN